MKKKKNSDRRWLTTAVLPFVACSLTFGQTEEQTTDVYPYLTFETADGTTATVAVGSLLKLTIDTDQSTLTAGSQQFSLADLAKMYFTKETTAKLAGDVNGDGTVDDLDVSATASHIVGLTPDDFDSEVADMDGSGVIDIADVTAIIELAKEEQTE